MSAESLRGVSDAYLAGAIAQLARTGEWPRRLMELRMERGRRLMKRRGRV